TTGETPTANPIAAKTWFQKQAAIAEGIKLACSFSSARKLSSSDSRYEREIPISPSPHRTYNDSTGAHAGNRSCEPRLFLPMNTLSMAMSAPFAAPENRTPGVRVWLAALMLGVVAFQWW